MTYVRDTDCYQPIDWSRLPDPYDRQVLDRANVNNWLPESVPVGNDKRSWEELSEMEKDVTLKVFGGLTLLDTLQSEVGVTCLRKYVENPHEDAVLCQFNYMEAIHAMSYSYIFMTLCTQPVIDRTKEWVKRHPELQKKASLIDKAYQEKDSMKVKIASVFLESFLFYSGFYWPLYLLSRNILTNTATVIKLIIRDEAMHGTYIGYKFRQEWETLSSERQESLFHYALELMEQLYQNEVKFTEDIYHSTGLASDVKSFLCLNANKTFQHLGFSELYPPEDCQVNPAILRSMRSDSAVTHDFFSVKGSSYFIARREDTTDEDWK